jgi:hypothetical protein
VPEVLPVERALEAALIAGDYVERTVASVIAEVVAPVQDE